MVILKIKLLDDKVIDNMQSDFFEKEIRFQIIKEK